MSGEGLYIGSIEVPRLRNERWSYLAAAASISSSETSVGCWRRRAPWVVKEIEGSSVEGSSVFGYTVTRKLRPLYSTAGVWLFMLGIVNGSAVFCPALEDDKNVRFWKGLELLAIATEIVCCPSFCWGSTSLWLLWRVGSRGGIVGGSGSSKIG